MTTNDLTFLRHASKNLVSKMQETDSKYSLSVEMTIQDYNDIIDELLEKENTEEVT